MKILNRSRLKRATQIILIPSMLSLMLIGSGHYSIDTDPSAPVAVKVPTVKEAFAFDMDLIQETTTTATSTITTTTTVTTEVSTAETTTTAVTVSTESATEPVQIEENVEEEEVVDVEPEESQIESEEPIEEEIPTEAEQTKTTEPVIEEPTYVVYKPSTHYIHTNKCRWYSPECYEIKDTGGIEARKCSECNPDMEIINEYVPETPTVADYDRQLLAEIVWHEAGSSYIGIYSKAKVAAGVMNRVYDSRFPGTVYGVLTQPGQFSGYWPGCCGATQDCYDAVDYYFSHTSEFNSDNSWWGDGYQNHFYYQ